MLSVNTAANRCFLWCKGTNLKANHNSCARTVCAGRDVSCGAKVLIWKQITTSAWFLSHWSRCFLWCKGTNLKANHNVCLRTLLMLMDVSCGAKVLIWKQITTGEEIIIVSGWCFLWCKGTNLKANHNVGGSKRYAPIDVSCGAKVLIWKQITTAARSVPGGSLMFLVVQRY